MNFKGRVRLNSLAASKAATPVIVDGKPDSSRYVMKPSVQVVFNAIKDGDEADSLYGTYTPSGEIKMTIANPVIADYLTKVWHECVTGEEEPGGTSYLTASGPRFEITFRPLD